MDLSIFESDDQIFQYIKDQLDKIHTLDECRLYKEEQLQLSEEMFWFRNCIARQGDRYIVLYRLMTVRQG